MSQSEIGIVRDESTQSCQQWSQRMPMSITPVKLALSIPSKYCYSSGTISHFYHFPSTLPVQCVHSSSYFDGCPRVWFSLWYKNHPWPSLSFEEGNKAESVWGMIQWVTLLHRQHNTVISWDINNYFCMIQYRPSSGWEAVLTTSNAATGDPCWSSSFGVGVVRQRWQQF